MIPKYIQLKENLSKAIVDKKYPLFSKLPTENELCEEYQVSRATVRQALSLLESEGIIEKKWGSGNIVIGSIDITNSKTIALLVPSISDDGFSKIYEDLKASLYRENLSLKVFESHNKQSEERQILSIITKDMYAGYIIKPAASALPSMNKDYLLKLLKWQQPLILMDTLPSIIPGVSVINHDNHGCGYLCGRHFINKGHKNIGGIFNPLDFSSIERFSGFADSVRDADLTLLEDFIFWKQSGNQGITDFIRSCIGEISALICDNEDIASKVIDTCNRNNISIPSDLSIICCQSTEDIGSTMLNITSMEPAKSVGIELAHAIIAQKKDGSNVSATLKYKLIPGETS